MTDKRPHDEFSRELFLALLKELYPQVKFTMNEGGGVLAYLNEDASQVFNAEYAWETYKAGGSSRAAFKPYRDSLDQMIAGRTTASEMNWETARDHLVAVLCEVEETVSVPPEILAMAKTEPQFAEGKLQAEYHVVGWWSALKGRRFIATFQHPKHLEVVTDAALKRWGVPDEAVQEVAAQRTLALLPAWEEQRVPSTGGGEYRYWMVAGHLGYEGSAAGLESAWDRLPIPRERLWLGCPVPTVAVAFEGPENPEDADKSFFALAMANAVQFILKPNGGGRPHVYGPRSNGQFVVQPPLPGRA